MHHTYIDRGEWKQLSRHFLLWIMNGSFSRVRQSLSLSLYIYKVPDFKCDLSVLNTKGRFYYPIVNIIHSGSPLHLQSPPFFGIISSKGRLCWVCILSFYRSIHEKSSFLSHISFSNSCCNLSLTIFVKFDVRHLFKKYVYCSKIELNTFFFS